MALAAGTGDGFFFDVAFHLLIRPTVYLYIDVLRTVVVFDELICTEPFFTFAAVDQRI